MIADANTALLVHYLFEWAALLAGVAVYRSIQRKKGTPSLTQPGQFAVLIGCLVGAALGNKLSFWLEYPNFRLAHESLLTFLFKGQSIIGGLLGGWIGVEIGKKFAGISKRSGDDFVLPILTGILIGRIGCFVAGLHDGTVGLPTEMPWGIDFGDGIPRHPTPLYEWLLALFAAITWPSWRSAFAHTPGLSFRMLMLVYLLWRLFVDTLKPVPYAYTPGLSGLQWLCMAASVIIIISLLAENRRCTGIINGHFRAEMGDPTNPPRALLLILACAGLVGGLGCATILTLSNDSSTALKHPPLFEDRVFALARPDEALAKKIGNDHSIAFLGERYTYLVTAGGDRLISIGEALDSSRLKLLEINSRLYLEDKKAWGTLWFIYRSEPETPDADLDEQLKSLGFEQDNQTTYRTSVLVEGTVLPPVRLNEGQLRTFTLRRNLVFYAPADSHRPSDSVTSLKLVGAMAVDLMTAPLQMFGLAVLVLFVAL